MRWVNRATIAAALLCAGCGNYSTEDLEFLAALPAREDLRTEVPAGGTAGAATVCTIRPAEVWLRSKPASDGWNAGVELVIGLVDAVRRYPPTWRRDDARGWGPFPDERHPGVEIQVLMSRDHPAELKGEPRYAYAFQGRWIDGTDGFRNIITGAFEGPSSARGKGFVSLDFDALWALGMNDAGTPRGTVPIRYDRTGDPVNILLTLYQDGFGIPQFAYAFRGWRDGSGKFGYRFRDSTSGNVLTVVASYGSSGAGRGSITVTTPLGFTGTVRQCWDAAACLVFQEDLSSIAGGPAGNPLDCPTVPEPPEDPFPPIVLAP